MSHLHNGPRTFIAFTMATIASLSLLLGTATIQASQTCEDASIKTEMNNPFFAFDNGVEGPGLETLEAKYSLLTKLGYDGIGPRGVQGIPEMLEALDRHGLDMHALYIGIQINPGQQKYDPLLKDVIKALKGRPTVIWLYIQSRNVPKRSPQADTRTVEVVREIADMAEESGLRVALYPHHKFYVETVEHALRIVDQVDRKNVGITFNLCHCLKNGNGERIPELLKKAKPRLMVVSINGADNEGGWDRLIQTLDRGEFDIYGFLKNVHQIGFTGPIGLQCYGVKGDPRENLKRSMEAWKTLKARVNAED